MGKVYTLDKKLLVGVPEVRIGDKLYPVDNRKKTAVKIMEISKATKEMESMDRVFELAFAENYKKLAPEIEDMPFPAYTELFGLVMGAVTGEDPEEVTARFQEAKAASKE